MRSAASCFLTKFFVAAMAFTLWNVGATQLFAQDHSQMHHMPMAHNDFSPPSTVLPPAQFVALDECDPTTFNAALGPDFCKNIALAAFGYATTLTDLLNSVASGHPSPNWDFEPDSINVPQGTVIKVTDMGGEPHTFTEVREFGGGFLAPLNGTGETAVPECVGGFSRVDVAKTRIIQGSTVEIPNLSKGEHRFQCCIHPWMRVTVNVQ